MTTEHDAATLDAGPQLDAEIARRVFGLEVEWLDEECSRDTFGARWVYGGEYYAIKVPYITDTEGNDEYLPPYSADIAAAWQVVEAMRERGYAYEVGSAMPGHGATFGRRFALDTYYAVGDTPALAICRAALKAVDANDDDAHP